MNNPIDQILDENNSENIILYNEKNEPVEFEQIAVIPVGEKTYVILKPAVQIPGMADDEALVFCIDTFEGEDCLIIVEDDDTVDHVFEVYYEVLREEGIDTD